MNGDTEFADDGEMSDDEQDNQDVLDEVGEDRRDPTTGSLLSAEDLRTVPEELIGRAGETSEDLTALFRNASADHVTDGFRGGSDEEDVEENPGEPPAPADPGPDNV